jgi:hypothetical protein
MAFFFGIYKNAKSKIIYTVMNYLSSYNEFLNERKTENIGFQSGDGGVARDTYINDMFGRDTGHFGTGKYFFSTRKQAKQYQPDNDNRPVTEIDLTGKKLYRPEDASMGYFLHCELKRFNEYGFRYIDTKKGNRTWKFDIHELENSINRMSTNFDIKLSVEQVIDMYEKVYEEYKSKKNNIYALRGDSFSTRIMKMAGYDGIDVRGLGILDTAGYGSVLYTNDKIQESFTQTQINLYTNEFKNILSKIDSPISKIILDFNSSLDISQINPTNIEDIVSYIRNGKKEAMKIGKLVTRILSEVNKIVHSSEIEKFVNEYKGAFSSMNSFHNFDLIYGENIRKFYLENTYGEGKGTLNQSCMRYDYCQTYLDIFVDNPDKVNLLILKNPKDKLKIEGRGGWEDCPCDGTN